MVTQPLEVPVANGFFRPVIMLIALHSKGRRAGKDTTANSIRDWCADHNLTYRRLAFADQVKLLVARALDIGGSTDEIQIARVDELKLYGQVEWRIYDGENEGRSGKMTGREFIINLAGDGPTTGARGLFGANFWLDQALPLHWDPCETDVTVITDLRFPEEAERVHYHGGYIVEIFNDRAESPGGRSEQGLPRQLIDRQLLNTHTIDALRERTRVLMNALWY